MDIADKIRTLIQERDYYKNKYEELKAVIESAITDTTKSEVHEDQTNDKVIREATRFDKLGINVGDTLYFKKDPSITFTVSDPINKVIYNGIEYSISKVVTIIMQEKYNSKSRGLCGTDYVRKEPYGKSLWELRKEMEAAGTYGNQVQPKLNEDDEDLAEFF